jgi:hypothetical protein
MLEDIMSLEEDIEPPGECIIGGVRLFVNIFATDDEEICLANFPCKYQSKGYIKPVCTYEGPKFYSQK